MEVSTVVDAALALAAAGYRVFPLRPLSKEPALKQWQMKATANLLIVEQMFDREGLGLGLACGPQPNGMNVVPLDIDPRHDGWDTWADLLATNPTEFSGAVIHRTPNGGAHIFFDAPKMLRNSRAKLGPGIDSRAAGGYVVLPPSRVPDLQGEVRMYTVASAARLEDARLLPMPEWVAEGLSAVPAGPAPRPRMVSGNGNSVADRLRAEWDWHAELVADGWRAVKQVGGDVYYARPGKTDRGHSAVLHPSGAFVVFTTEAPPGLERIGKPTVDGTGFTVSPFHYLAAMRHGGDMTAAARSLSNINGPAPDAYAALGGRMNGSEAGPLTDVFAVDGTPDVSTTLPILGDSFWEARPVLAHIRQAAQALMVAPDALLMNVLARWSALIPPCYRLPALVGGQGTFDLLTCVVAESSGGKSIATPAARSLVNTANELIMMEYPIGSGEGLAQAFMVPETDVNEKGQTVPTGRQIVGKQALHLVVDEGMAFTSTAGRKGTTIVPALCSAWSGATLGQTNASGETRRVIPGGLVRIAATINMQSSNSYHLFSEAMTVIGFTGRVLFGSAHDHMAPALADLPDHPGYLGFPNLPIITSGIELEYDPQIVQEVRQERRAVLVGERSIDLTQSQHLLLRCKLAGILALQENRRDINIDDWSLAHHMLLVSRQVVSALGSLRAQQLAEQRFTQATVRGEAEYVAESAKERRSIAELSERIIERVKDAAEGGVGRRDLMRAMTSSKTRQRFNPALDRAVAGGKVVERDGRLYLEP